MASLIDDATVVSYVHNMFMPQINYAESRHYNELNFELVVTNVLAMKVHILVWFELVLTNVLIMKVHVLDAYDRKWQPLATIEV